MDDRRNTDNAWVETLVTSYHDQDNLFHKLKLTCTEEPHLTVEWVSLTQDVVVRPNHHDFLKLVYYMILEE